MPLANGYHNGNGEKREWKAPYTEEELRLILIEKFSTNYFDKFGTKHVQAKNYFSVSSLVSGPGTVVGQRKRTLAATDVETGEEAKTFNMQMFRGSAIHRYAEEKLPDWHAYGSEKGKKLYISETIPYDWQDGVTKGIIITGHPDAVKDDIVLELKTISTTQQDAEKKRKYKELVVKKAYRQAGCYAKMLSQEIKRHYFAYVVTFDEDPEKHVITDLDKSAGFIMINGGQTKLQLDDKMIKRGFVYDSSLRTYLLTDDEAWHGYNYCRWSARKAVEMIENEEAGKVVDDEIPVIGPLGKQK